MFCFNSSSRGTHGEFGSGGEDFCWCFCFCMVCFLGFWPGRKKTFKENDRSRKQEVTTPLVAAPQTSAMASMPSQTAAIAVLASVPVAWSTFNVAVRVMYSLETPPPPPLLSELHAESPCSFSGSPLPHKVLIRTANDSWIKLTRCSV